jgi:hypothetical protein
MYYKLVVDGKDVVCLDVKAERRGQKLIIHCPDDIKAKLHLKGVEFVPATEEEFLSLSGYIKKFGNPIEVE